MPFKSSLAKSAGKLLGVYREDDLSLRGATQGTRFVSSEVNPREHFNVKLYDGDDATSNAITGLGFSPDLVWIKNRDQSESHIVKDTIRGVGSALYSDSSSAADTGSTYSDRFPSFDADGFTVGSTHTGTNSNGDEFVAWCWNAGSSTVSNTDGSITSSVRANPTAGFSIGTYTGTGANASVGHSLNAAPEMILVKSRNYTDSWHVYHVGMSNTHFLRLDTSDNRTDRDTVWQDTTPTSTVFSIGTDNGVNNSTKSILFYAFTSVEGYSKIGSYTGNGGEITVTTGFEPSFLLVKDLDGGNDWYLFDSERSDYVNPSNTAAAPGSDFSNHQLQSNGFYFNTSNAAVNGNGDEYIYAAFA